MTRKLKPVDVPVEAHISEGVLKLPVVGPEGGITTVGETVALASQLLKSANEAIQNNPLCEVAAQSLMRTEKRRGVPSFVVDTDFRVSLHIEYANSSDEVLEAAEPLPSLDVLRERAQVMGVEIGDLGRQKRAIIKRLEQRAR